MTYNLCRIFINFVILSSEFEVNYLICSKFNTIILQKIIIYQSELTKKINDLLTFSIILFYWGNMIDINLLTDSRRDTCV